MHQWPWQVQMGCHTKETRLFVTQKAGCGPMDLLAPFQANGIMGLAPARSAPTVLQDIFRERRGSLLSCLVPQDHAHVDSAVFSMCLAPQGGLLTVGGYNASLASRASWPEGEPYGA